MLLFSQTSHSSHSGHSSSHSSHTSHSHSNHNTAAHAYATQPHSTGSGSNISSDVGCGGIFIALFFIISMIVMAMVFVDACIEDSERNGW